MNLDKMIEQKIKESRIYGVTKPSIIKEILELPKEINIKKLDKVIDNFYDTFYIEKTWAKKKLTNEQKRMEFLNIEKEIAQRFVEIPDEDSTKYRKIVTINQEWLKKSQKRFN